MNRFCPIVTLLCFLSLLIATEEGKCAVTVTPASGTCLNVSPGAYTAIGSIVIDENSNGDFAIQANTTLVLTIPTGFQFQAGTGSVSYTTGKNISSASIVITATTITVTYSASGNNRDDKLTISGLVARATVAGAAGNILRTGGAANINGDASGGGVNHGSLSGSNAGTTIVSAAAGNWSSGATWVGGVAPSCDASVLILHNVTANVSASVDNLTINNGGTLTATNAITVGGAFNLLGTGSYEHNNTTNASTTIFAGTENFSVTSNITISKWYNTGIPFPKDVNGNFGNITFDQGGAWSQDGLFAPAKIKGTLTISSGSLTMDDGTGMTTALTLQDVVMNGSGSMRIATGTNRNLTLVTGNYTDARTSGGSYSGIQFNCVGNVSWTANGNINIGADWSYYEGTGASLGNSSVTINGNLNVSGGKFDFNRNVQALMNLQVNGDINITGTPGWVRFMDRNTEALTVTTNNFIISGGNANNFLGGSGPLGSGTFNILNDFILNNTSTVAYFMNSTGNSTTLSVSVGRDMIINSGDLGLANSKSSVTLNVSRNLVINGANGDFYAQVYPNAATPVNIHVNGYLQVNSGDFYASLGIGNATIDVVETLDINNGGFFGINNLAAANNGSVTLTCNDIDFDGGTFHLMNSRINDAKTVTVNVNNDITIDFLNATDIFTFIGNTGTNNPKLDLNVTNNFTANGNFAGSYFLSSASTGDETIDIGGNLTVNNGDIFFVGNESSLLANHNIIMNIAGNLNISGGNTRLSTGVGTADININGNVVQSNGTLNLKFDSGVTTMDVAGSYTQSGGLFNLHSKTSNTTDIITATINGNFLMSNGTINFDAQASGAGMAEHILKIAGTSYILDGNAKITHANNLTNNYIFGHINFTYPGTTTYTRNTNTNVIEHVKYTINTGTTVNATSSPNGFQMTSIGSNVAATHNALTVDGTLDMGSKVLSARQYGSYYSRITVNSGGRYRTSHTGGLYSGNSLAPSSIDGYVTTFNRVNYELNPNSIVEYYGTATTVVTGIPNGYASGNNQKYGILEINFTGAAGSTWVTPETDGEVFIRSSLVLTNGEFNLDSDHTTNTGGKSIMLESGATTSRTNGFIRSETEDASAKVKWVINTNGSRIVPFGYDAANYIPFTFQQTSGAAGTVAFATYRTAADNTPLPPTVTHVRDVSGNDNSSNTVDRFWLLTTSGAANANLTFSYVGSEGTGILAPRAQLWEPVSTGWFPPAAGQSNPTVTSTQVGSISGFNTWWTLAAGASPLPVELISFDAKKDGKEVNLNWQTATEINNDYFTIERSSNGINFEPLLTVNGAGNSTSILSYSINDKSPLNGINYYRLKQTDFDGKNSYSEIKSVLFGKTGSYNIYPNPIASNSELVINVPESGDYIIQIIDATGRMLHSEKRTLVDENEMNINMANLNYSPGIYQILITGQTEHFAQKLIIKE